MLFALNNWALSLSECLFSMEFLKSLTLAQKRNVALVNGQVKSSQHHIYMRLTESMMGLRPK